MKKFSEICDKKKVDNEIPDEEININEIILFINRVDKNSGYIDFVDAFRLLNYYIEIFGVKYMDRISIEDELIYYYGEIKLFIRRKITNIKYFRKKCNACKEVKTLNEFSKRRNSPDKLEYKCRACIKIYNNNRKKTIIP